MMINRFSALLLYALPGAVLADEAGNARAEALLNAMGGRAAWAKVKYVHVEAVHDDVSIRDVFANKQG